MISIIILTYNRFALLSKTISSILSQTYKNFEVLIINDGSTDETTEILNHFTDSRLSINNLEKQNNLAKLRNYGIQKSKGEFISFCDDDDIWEPQKLQTQTEYLVNYDFVCSNAKLIDIHNNVIDDKYIKSMSTGIIETEKLLLENLIMPSSVVFKKKILKGNNNPFDEHQFVNLCEDYNLWIKLSMENKLFFLDETLILHRTHASWARNFKHRQEIYENHVKLVSPFLKSNDTKIRDSAYMSILNNKYYSLKNLLDNKKYSDYSAGLISFIFLFKNPKYIKAIYKRVKEYLK